MPHQMNINETFDRIANLLFLIDEEMLRTVESVLFVKLEPTGSEWVPIDAAGVEALTRLATWCVHRRVKAASKHGPAYVPCRLRSV